MTMGCVVVSNGTATTATVRVAETAEVLQFTDHFSLVRQLIAKCDSCLLAAPFLYEAFAVLFENLSIDTVQFELISSYATRGNDQLKKPFCLRSFGQVVRHATGKWPFIHLNETLHSKIYIFRKGGHPFAGIVTSANLTASGLSRNHETGLLLDDSGQLEQLAAVARRGLSYVHLAEHQIDRLCLAAEVWRQRNGPPEENIDVGLGNILNRYATPAAGNRNIQLANNARYFVKVSGDRDNPILPEDEEPWVEPHGKLDFAKSPDKAIVIGDCLLEVAVGGKCFLSYYACASEPYERTEQEKESNPAHKRWPFYVYGNNLSLHYGEQWFRAPIMIDETVNYFKALHPSVAVTTAGKDHIKGAIQMGNSYFQVTREFGEFVRQKIDASFAPTPLHG
jgi:hypothetical protein